MAMQKKNILVDCVSTDSLSNVMDDLFANINSYDVVRRYQSTHPSYSFLPRYCVPMTNGIMTTFDFDAPESGNIYVPKGISIGATFGKTLETGSKLMRDDIEDGNLYLFTNGNTMSINMCGEAAVTYASMRSIDDPSELAMMVICDNIWYYPDINRYNTTAPQKAYNTRNVGYCDSFLMQRFVYRGYIADNIFYMDGGKVSPGYGTYTIGKEKFVKINSTNLYMRH